MITREQLPELESVEELVEHFASIVSPDALAAMVEVFEPTPPEDYRDVVRAWVDDPPMMLEVMVPHDTPPLHEEHEKRDDTFILRIVDGGGMQYARRNYVFA